MISRRGWLWLPLGLALLGASTVKLWLTARPDFAWSFPRDHHAHPGYRTEWWYFTGHLEAESGERFGYQFTLFRIGLTPDTLALNSDWAAHDLVMGHAAVSDLTRGSHRFSELLYRATPLLGGFPPPGDSLLAWSRAAVGSDGRWQVRWNGQGFDFAMRDDARSMSFDLSTHAVKPLVLQGPNGYSTKGDAAGAASQYYSFTRLATTGALRIDGQRYAVRGTSWMDKEFGSNQLAPGQTGWDWWSLQLDDGRELMLYRLRRGEETDFARGTLVEASGQARILAPEEWRSESIEIWKSGATESTYPSRWRVRVPGAGLDLDVVPELADQENVGRLSGGVHYWEGAVSVRDAKGTAIGQGYVELTGYGRGSRPPI